MNNAAERATPSHISYAVLIYRTPTEPSRLLSKEFECWIDAYRAIRAEFSGVLVSGIGSTVGLAYIDDAAHKAGRAFAEIIVVNN